MSIYIYLYIHLNVSIRLSIYAGAALKQYGALGPARDHDRLRHRPVEWGRRVCGGLPGPSFGGEHGPFQWGWRGVGLCSPCLRWWGRLCRRRCAAGGCARAVLLWGGVSRGYTIIMILAQITCAPAASAIAPAAQMSASAMSASSPPAAADRAAASLA